MSVEVKNLYSKRAEERRRQFNNIIRGIDLVLMNNITEVDESVWENFEGDSPLTPDECEWFVNDATEPAWCCDTHMFDGTGDYPAKDEAGEDNDHPDQCDFADSDYTEVFQWFAVGDSDADFLKRHGQYITYSDQLDTYFLAICHYGTSWDYVESMVEAFNDCYTGLEDFSDNKEEN